jgi:hypothetical protein
MPVGRTRPLVYSVKQRLNGTGKIFPSSCGGRSVEKPVAKFSGAGALVLRVPPGWRRTQLPLPAQSIV